ncbi:MAG: hypothetical protein K8F29_11025 [Kofleriaceae bacterium]|nr:hypothetical protein [Candidatus Methylomirabilis lanthanidiphila]
MNTHVERSRRTRGQRMINGKMARPSRDYFGEALRILDNDMTIEPQREHLATLWGVVVGLTRKLTQVVVECEDGRCATTDTRHSGKTAQAFGGPNKAH